MRRAARGVAAALTLWLIAAFVVVPILARRLAATDDAGVLDQNLALWRAFALRLTIGLAAACLLVLLALQFRTRIAARARQSAAVFPARGMAGIIFVSLWIGGLAGLIEATIAMVRRFVLDLPTGAYTSVEVFWIAPLAASGTLVVLGTLTGLADRMARADGALTGTLPAVFVSLAVFSATRRLQLGLHSVAVALLAVGVGVQVTRLMIRNAQRTRRLVRRSVPVMTVAAVAWALIVPVGRSTMEARSVAGLPVPPAESPNVLLIVWDAVRAASLSAYGYTRETTPQLERMASEGILFERAIATSPWSLPTHASLFTGLYPIHLNVDWNTPLDDSEPTLAEVLAARGYATAGFVGNRYYAGSAVGLSRGFGSYHDRMNINIVTVFGTWWLSAETIARALGSAFTAFGRERMIKGRSASEIIDSFLDWSDRPGDRPWFAFINVIDAHNPYIPPPPFDRVFSDEPLLQSIPPDYVHEPAELAELRTSYESCIRYLDAELGRLLEALRQAGTLDNTIVIVTSDHGEEFGEHGPDLVEHGRSLYLPVIHVPLVIRYPPLGADVRRPGFVSLRDVPATILDLLRIDDGLTLPGRTLFEPTDTAPTDAPVIFATVQKHIFADNWPGWPASAGDMQSALSGSTHYIRDARGLEFLFDVDTDYWEQNNLVGDTAWVRTLNRLRFATDAFLMSPADSVLTRSAASAPVPAVRRAGRAASSR